MTTAYPAHSTRGRSRDNEGAAPAFAITALLMALGGSAMDRLLSSGQKAPLSGMVTAYLLMGAFHSPPPVSRLQIS
jgi:hypothetical protein